MSTARAEALGRPRAARTALLGLALLARCAAAGEGPAAPGCDVDAPAAGPAFQAVRSWDNEFASLLATRPASREHLASGGSSRGGRARQPTYATGARHRTVPELQPDEAFSEDFVEDSQPGGSTAPLASSEADDLAGVVDNASLLPGAEATARATDAASTGDDTIASAVNASLDGAISGTADAANDTLSSTLSDLCRKYSTPCGALRWLTGAEGSTSANESSQAAGTNHTARTADTTFDDSVNDTVDGVAGALGSAVDAANDTLSRAMHAISGALEWLTDALDSASANNVSNAGSTSDAASTSEKPEATVTASADAGAGEEPKHAPRRLGSESVAMWLLMLVLIASGAIVFVALSNLE